MRSLGSVLLGSDLLVYLHESKKKCLKTAPVDVIIALV
jgi:hypothetical protein